MEMQNVRERTLSSYFRMTLLNEALFGLPRDYFEYQLNNADTKINFDFNKFYICLTGLKKSVYTGVYGFDSTKYMNLAFLPSLQKIGEYMRLHNYCFEHVLIINGLSKQIAVLFSPMPNSDVTPLRAAQYITEVYQAEYEKNMFGADTPYCNFSALSEELHSYEEIAPAFASVTGLNNLSFFVMQPTVMTKDKYNELKRPLQRTALFDTLRLISNAVINRRPDLVQNYCSNLFLQKLKWCFDFDLCSEALYELKKQVSRYVHVFDFSLRMEFDKAFSLGGYASIEVVFSQMNHMLVLCAQAAAKYVDGLSSITMDALQYLSEHFSEDIALSEVASYVNVSPEYLSRKFSKDVGVTLHAYLMQLRISRAKELLENSNLRISGVAEAIGMQSKYFGRVFKQMEDVTPQEYRKNIAKKEH